MAFVSIRVSTKIVLLRCLLVLALGLLLVGLMAPIVTMTKLIFFENTFSVFSGVVQLFEEGKYFLFCVIALFSIALPCLKIVMLFLILANSASMRKKLQQHLRWMHQFGKWSMLDVFIVAVLVVSVKLGAIVHVDMRYGLYAFAASVVLTMFVTAQTVMLVETNFKGKIPSHNETP